MKDHLEMGIRFGLLISVVSAITIRKAIRIVTYVILIWQFIAIEYTGVDWGYTEFLKLLTETMLILNFRRGCPVYHGVVVTKVPREHCSLS